MKVTIELLTNFFVCVVLLTLLSISFTCGLLFVVGVLDLIVQIIRLLEIPSRFVQMIKIINPMVSTKTIEKYITRYFIHLKKLKRKSFGRIFKSKFLTLILIPCTLVFSTEIVVFKLIQYIWRKIVTVDPRVLIPETYSPPRYQPEDTPYDDLEQKIVYNLVSTLKTLFHKSTIGLTYLFFFLETCSFLLRDWIRAKIRAIVLLGESLTHIFFQTTIGKRVKRAGHFLCYILTSGKVLFPSRHRFRAVRNEEVRITQRNMEFTTYDFLVEHGLNPYSYPYYPAEIRGIIMNHVCQDGQLVAQFCQQSLYRVRSQLWMVDTVLAQSLLGKVYSGCIHGVLFLWHKVGALWYRVFGSYPRMRKVDPLRLFRGGCYLILLGLNVYGYNTVRNHLYFSDILMISHFLTTPEGCEMLVNQFLSLNMSEDDFYAWEQEKHQRDCSESTKLESSPLCKNPGINDDKTIEDSVRFFFSGREGHLRAPFPLLLNGNTTNFFKIKKPTLIEFYDTMAAFNGYPSLAEMGITEDHSTVLWILLNFLTGNSYVPVVDVLSGNLPSTSRNETSSRNETRDICSRYEFCKDDRTGIRNETSGPVGIETEAKWEEDPTGIPPFGSNQTELLAGLNILWRLKQQFPQLNNRLAHLPFLKKAFRNFTTPSILVWMDYVRCESENILAREKVILGLMPLWHMRDTITHYCFLKISDLIPHSVRLSQFPLSKIPLNIRQNIVTPTKELSERFGAILQRHMEPTVLYKKWPAVNPKWVYSAFLRFNERFAVFKYKELLDNNATFEDRFEALEQFFSNIRKGRDQSNKKKCPVYGISRRCEDVLSMLRYGIGFSFLGAITTFFPMIEWFPSTDKAEFGPNDACFHTYWSFLAGFFYWVLLARTAKGYRFFSNESRNSTMLASIPDYVGEASFRISLVIWLTLVWDNFFFPVLIGWLAISVFQVLAEFETDLRCSEPSDLRCRWEPLVYDLVLVGATHFYTIHGRDSVGWYAILGFFIYSRVQNFRDDLLQSVILPLSRQLGPIGYRILTWDVQGTLLYMVAKGLPYGYYAWTTV